MKVKLLSIALLLSGPCMGGITKNMKPHGDTSCGVLKAMAKRIYRFKVNTGKPDANDTIECDGGQLFHVKDKGWTPVADLKDGNAIKSDILKSPDNAIWFPISNIETIDKDTETFTIRDCPFKERPISKTWISTINMYHVPGPKCEKLNANTLDRNINLQHALDNFACENRDMRHNNPERYEVLKNELLSNMGQGKSGGNGFIETMHQH